MIRKDTNAAALKELVTKPVTDLVKQARQFVDGDHWQSGAGWVGPRPPDTDVGSEVVMVELERTFTSANRVEEVSDRHASGIVGREPQWSFGVRAALAEGQVIPPADVQAIDELEAAVTEWWNLRGVHEKLHTAVMNVAWGQRSVLRLYVPAGLLLVPPKEKTLAAYLLQMVHVDVISPEYGVVHHDPSTKQPLGVVIYKNEKDEDVVEATYLDDTRENTFIDVITGDKVETSTPLQLGGHITMHELRRTPLVNKQMLQQQRQHNLALTILGRNLVSAGFLERTMLNAAMPGTWDEDPITHERTNFVPAKLRIGAGSTTWLEGIESVDAVTGKTTLTSPDVKYRDPSPVTPTLEAASGSYRCILEEAQQAHILLASEATASGRSRVEARKDFESSLKLTKPIVDRAGRWLIETAVALAEAVMSGGNGTGSLLKYRADFNTRLDTGVVTPEEREQNDRSVAAGTLPKEYAIAGHGVDDVDLAMQLISSQTGVVLDDLKKRAEIVKAFTDAGAGLEGAALAAGIDPAVVTLLLKGGDDEDDDQTDAG